MLSKEIREKIELIRLCAKDKVTETFTGNYESAFKGQGIEFDEVKEYVAGDDYRAIDWNVTARTGIPHIKRYVEERELSILFVLDISASSGFKSRGLSRLEMMANIVAALALAAAKSNDKTGLLLFSDRVIKLIPPTKGSQHTIRLIEEIMSIQERKGEKTDIAKALNYLCEITGKRWIIFLLSDFYDSRSNWLKIYKNLHSRFDFIPIRPVVQADKELPNAGLITLRDPETGKLETFDSSSPFVRKEFKKNYQLHQDGLIHSFAKVGTPLLLLSMDRDWISQLIDYFNRREKRRVI